MSTSLLGNHFDIHGGGQDLLFPHHENELAQSESCTGEKFVNYWMHNGHVQVNEEKMSKSLGNFFVLREVLMDYKAEEIRYFLINSHYRSQLNYSDKQLDNARAALQRLYTALMDTRAVDIPTDNEYQQRFDAALSDDFNTAIAVAVLFDLARDINRAKAETSDEQHSLASLLRHLGGIIGLLQADAEDFLKSGTGQSVGLSDTAIDELIEQRLQARANKDWANADRIRDELSAAGIVIEDGPDGTRWRRG
jgi:cysteinyl-tRNA synthetase